MVKSYAPSKLPTPAMLELLDGTRKAISNYNLIFSPLDTLFSKNYFGSGTLFLRTMCLSTPLNSPPCQP